MFKSKGTWLSHLKNMLIQGDNLQGLQLTQRPEHVTCEGTDHPVAREVQVCHNVQRHDMRAKPVL